MTGLPKGLIHGKDTQIRCWWPGEDERYIRYHDEEWGTPVSDDCRLFEKICLEGFQSGLSWLTILRKRENFRAAFDNFDFKKVAHYTQKDVERCLQDVGIVRHRGKIEAVINNARAACEMVECEGSLAHYFWSWEPLSKNRPVSLDYETLCSLSITEESKALSKDLKKRGWHFVGPTTAYAFMQAMGLVNDHLEGCLCREKVEEARRSFKRPA